MRFGSKYMKGDNIMNRKCMFCFLISVGLCGLVNAREVSRVTEEYWDDVILGRVIVSYDNSIDVHKASAKELGIADKGVFEIVMESVAPLNFVVVQVAKDIEKMKKFIELMEKQPNVEYAEPDRWGEITFHPDDKYYDEYQYDKPQMNCEAAWDYTLGDTSISVAIVDQGTQYTHPDLAAHYGDYKGYDYWSNDDDPMPESSSENHATHCSGVAAAVINNDTGIAGVANVRLYSYRCIDVRGIVHSSITANGVTDAANHGANVISMSFSWSIGSSTFHNAVKYAWNKGCLLCGSSGNTGTSGVRYPAHYDEVIAVGAINKSDQRRSSSTYGPDIELVAGGDSILSTVPFGDYLQLSGTSMSCPNIAGAAALVWSANPSFTNQEVRAILCSTAVDLGTQGRDNYYGYGKPDLYEAIRLVSIEESEKSQVTSYKLQVHPNPFTQMTEIRYQIPANSQQLTAISLKIHDITGREVGTLIDGQKEAGNYTLNIDMRNFSSGIYFVSLKTSDTRVKKTKKIILME